MSWPVGALAGAAGVLLARRKATSQLLPAWDRSSFDGSSVSLTGGVHTFAGIAASSLAAGRLAIPALIANVSGAVAGYVDDHLESKFPAQGKGFGGHLGALKGGQITSGLTKIGVIGAGAVLAAAAIPREKNAGRLVHVGVDSLLIASTANVINLLDLRPGRALKAAGMAAVPVALSFRDGSSLGAGIVATSLTALPTDLRGETMLGDLGANALGAQLGVGIAASSPLPVRMAVLAGVVGLTAASEKVSFSEVIENNPVLHKIDKLGR